jgi:DNA-binding GntR family transcriptional regulator
MSQRHPLPVLWRPNGSELQLTIVGGYCIQDAAPRAYRSRIAAPELAEGRVSPSGPASAPIKRHTPFREQVQAYLKNRIMEGAVPPGTRLVETQVAQELGVSRTPVREALHVLQGQGFLEGQAGTGYRVKSLNWDEIEQICEIRILNETLAAVWASRRITAEELEALEENLCRAEGQIRAGSPESFVERDGEIKEILARASGTELRRHMLQYRVKSLDRPESALAAVEQHRKILGCLREGDEERLRWAVKDHIERSKEDIRSRAFESEGPGETGDKESGNA